VKPIQRLLINNNKWGSKYLILVSVLVFLFGAGLVWMDVNDEINAELSDSSHLIEKELDILWHKIESTVNTRSFQTNLSFNVNLAAMNQLDAFVEQSEIKPKLFVYDAEQRYFGKNKQNSLNRFAYKIHNMDWKDKHFRWKFFEKDSERFVERYLQIRASEKIIGYLRVIIPLKELQDKIFEKREGLAHLSTENLKYSYVRCVLNQPTDLLVCVPLDSSSVFKKSGSLLAFVLLFWVFLVFLIATYLRSKLAQARAQTLVEISSQVSHDIQSPLLALKVATKGLAQMPEDQRLMLQRSIERIEDIVNDLKNKRDDNLDSTNKMEHHILYGLVSSILSEKRLQFKYRDIQFELISDAPVHSSFVQLNQKDFKRVLSNLINNAVEAIEGQGEVKILLEESADCWVLKLIDNGRGIPEKHLKDIFKKGFSINKDRGQGLGLYHAAKMADEWSAELLIQSKESEGTMVELHIPKAESPEWFPSIRSITEQTQIVVIDDDQNIHDMWTKRFADQGFTNSFFHFYHIESAQKNLQEIDLNNAVFLVDYELIHSTKNGIDFILNNQLVDKSVLVTARYDDEKIISSCKYFGISLLPKLLMNEFKLFTMQGREDVDVVVNEVKELQSQALQEPLKNKMVLIDDDPLVRKLWQLSARAKNIDFKAYASPKDFMDASSEISKDTSLFIDVDLGESSGLEWSKDLFELGYKDLRITTGFDDIDLSGSPWIKEVLSKEPPFRNS
jgi:signal transduction histidine kinase/FixJ family two-component response regulator